MIRSDPTFVLLDDQQVAFNAVLAKVRARHLATQPSVIVVRGGPGTGKSVIAVNLVAELAQQGYVVHHATGSRAFTTALRKRVGTKAAALFKYFNSFMRAEVKAEQILRQNKSVRSVTAHYAIATGKTSSGFEDGVNRPSSEELWAKFTSLDEDKAVDLIVAMAAEAGRFVQQETEEMLDGLRKLVAAYIDRDDQPGTVDWDWIATRTMRDRKSGSRRMAHGTSEPSRSWRPLRPQLRSSRSRRTRQRSTRPRSSTISTSLSMKASPAERCVTSSV
jgi:hypothetical protein